MDLWRKRRLSGVLVEAQAVFLGECMYAGGIDDGDLGAKISALDEQLRQAEAVGAPITICVRLMKKPEKKEVCY
jgi:hypothetical protein